MKQKSIVYLSGITIVLLLLVPGLVQAQSGTRSPAGTGFTYQGQLKSDDLPYTGTCDFQFSLYDALSSGGQVGSTLTTTNVGVAEGYFTVLLDFGAAAFDGQARWLNIAVRCPAGSGTYTTLTPRQALTPTPYAIHALAAPWSGLTGIPAGFLDGIDNDTTYTAGTGLTLTGTQFSANTAILQARVIGVCGSGQAIKSINADGTVACESVSGGGGGWLLTGNADTTPGTHYLGTSDNQAFEIKVNGHRALRIEPNYTSPNLIGGYYGNWITDLVIGATIAGGGSALYENRVTDYFGTIGGGENNLAGNDSGDLNDASYTTVSGGGSNTASGEFSTVCGGGLNTSSGDFSTVLGGTENTASGNYSVAAGYGAQASQDKSFVWSDSFTNSIMPNTFHINAKNGVFIVANTTDSYAAYIVNQINGVDNGEGTSVVGLSNSDLGYGVAGWNYYYGSGLGAWSFGGNLIEAYAGDFPGGSLRFKVDQAGNLYYTGSMIPMVTTTTREGEAPENISFYGISATESWLEDLGSAQLVEGLVQVGIDPLFAQAANLSVDYQVQLTAVCDQPVLLFVSEKTPTFFTAQGVSLDGQQSSCGFDYRVTAKRAGYESQRMEAVDMPETIQVERETLP